MEAAPLQFDPSASVSIWHWRPFPTPPPHRLPQAALATIHPPSLPSSPKGPGFRRGLGFCQDPEFCQGPGLPPIDPHPVQVTGAALFPLGVALQVRIFGVLNAAGAGPPEPVAGAILASPDAHYPACCNGRNLGLEGSTIFCPTELEILSLVISDLFVCRIAFLPAPILIF